eukprot:CAMPEP_0115026988 /NCGR_PEP_ID=MMETSP0216-20121206/35151_1 /TAXON_ID=223996 /ORGANISM="Protocruzia adherens, Strain Boccale" /LENGTH=425 /DNA_ID=CAMNT_0002402323 /DNA_START=31 /DNA_END=1308 /DNA_ORIENTATION=+
MVAVWSFGTGRQREKKNGTPGPGSYQDRSTFHGKRGNKWVSPSNRGRHRTSHSLSGNPGPGQYEAETKVGETPKYSMLSRGNSAQDLRIRKTTPGITPGPGSYFKEKASKTTDAKGFSFGLKHYSNNGQRKFGRDERKDPLTPLIQKSTPGPGTYDRLNKTFDGSPCYNFDKVTSRDQGAKEKKPGPGQYDTVSDFRQESKSPTMPGRRKFFIEERINKVSPGPGNYNPKNSRFRSNPSYGFAISREPTEVDLSMVTTVVDPAPGSYDPDFKKGSTVCGSLESSFSKAARPDVNKVKKDLSPGPGAYETRGRVGGPKFSMRTRPSSSGRPKTPGPGSYRDDDRVVQTHYGSFGFGYGEKCSKLNVSSESKAKPGPGNYKVNSRMIEGPQFSFSKEVKITPLKKTGGPEFYDVPAFVPDIQKYQLK